MIIEQRNNNGLVKDEFDIDLWEQYFFNRKLIFGYIWSQEYHKLSSTIYPGR